MDKNLIDEMSEELAACADAFVKADEVLDQMIAICALITGHVPKQGTTADAVAWLVERHKASTAALMKLEEIRSDKLAANGMGAEATALSAARHLLRNRSTQKEPRN